MRNLPVFFEHFHTLRFKLFLDILLCISTVPHVKYNEATQTKPFGFKLGRENPTIHKPGLLS